jgi:ABC-type antimicrobial peptide transport system permease subunit
VLTSFLFGVTPTDPATLLLVAIGLGAVALIACYVPSRRAASVDPMTTLRRV